MTKLTREDILHVAKLAKLDIDDNEIKKYYDQLSKVVNYFSEISEVDTKDTEPTSQTTGLENVLRVDDTTPQNCLSQNQVLSGSDEIYNGYFKVKAILSERSDK